MRLRLRALAPGPGLAVLLAYAPQGPAPPGGRISLSPSAQVIRITPRYRGELLHVWGTAPVSDDVVRKLTSARETVLSSVKRKVGPFWLSVGKVRFDSVPRMFKIKSTAPLDDILPDAELLRYRLGQAGLKASIRVTPASNHDVDVDELIRIREGERLFSFSERGVQRRGASYAASFFWPPDGPPGRYRIEAYAVSGGHVVGAAQTWIEVQAVGLEAWVRSLARDHGVLYGLFAVGLAMTAGLAAWLVFAVGRRAGAAGSGPAAG